jgi:hypothetical protein
MNGAWTWTQEQMKGDAYKTVVEGFSQPGARGCTVNSDNGISIFWKPTRLDGDPVTLTYKNLKKRPHLICLLDCCDVDMFINALQRYNNENSTNIRHSQCT